jgi:uncharacterized protein (DUF305 family)
MDVIPKNFLLRVSALTAWLVVLPAGYPIGCLVLTQVLGTSCRTASPRSNGSAPQNPATQPGDATPRIIQPGAPGQPSKVVSADSAVDLTKVQFTGDDVRFMQGMISHHAQAIEMTNLLATRTNNAQMRLLAKRIDLSQADEIKMMQRWLKVRGQEVPDPMAHQGHEGMSMPGMNHGNMLMPGMLTPVEMTQLAAAKGAEFDRLFLEGMIKHHGGALTMVHELFATPGAGQETEVFSFASDVDADQRMEIDRMGAMLQEFQK